MSHGNQIRRASRRSKNHVQVATPLVGQGQVHRHVSKRSDDTRNREAYEQRCAISRWCGSAAGRPSRPSGMGPTPKPTKVAVDPAVALSFETAAAVGRIIVTLKSASAAKMAKPPSQGLTLRQIMTRHKVRMLRHSISNRVGRPGIISLHIRYQSTSQRNKLRP
jgi:hypothetical protein